MRRSWHWKRGIHSTGLWRLKEVHYVVRHCQNGFQQLNGKKSFLKENENKEVIEFQWKKVLYRFALLNSSISVTIAGKVRLVQCKNETCV